MPVNQVYKATGEKIIDISDSTVTAANMAQGVTAYDASGAKITGSMQGGLDISFVLPEGNYINKIPWWLFNNNQGSGSTNKKMLIRELKTGANVIDTGYGGSGNGGTFEKISTLTSVQFENMKIIRNSCFRQCTNLVDVDLGESVETIQSRAFEGCGIEAITIPSTIQTIEGNVFLDCTSLATITINKPQGSISGSPWGAPNATVVWTG